MEYNNHGKSYFRIDQIMDVIICVRFQAITYYHWLVMTNQSESFIEIQITPVPVYIIIVKIISDPSTCVSAVIICKL